MSLSLAVTAIEISATIAFALSGLLAAAGTATLLRSIALLTGFTLPSWTQEPPAR